MTRGPAMATANAVTAAFSGIARLRQARVFHPRGRSFDATFVDAGLLPGAGTGDAVVRVSKAIPTPGQWPDILGIAVRLQGPVDLLFATTGGRPGLRHLLMPRAGFMDGLYTTLLPYEVAGDTRVLALRPERAAGPTGVRLDTFEAALPVTFTVLSAPLTGGWRPCGELIVHTRRSADVPWFDVHAHCVPELRPAGPFQSLRRRAYAGSRRGRGLGAAGPVERTEQPARDERPRRAREPERRSTTTADGTEHSERGKDDHRRGRTVAEPGG